jgi:phosphoglycolate phosphatase
LRVITSLPAGAGCAPPPPPHPDMVLAAAARFADGDPRAVAVAGDTVGDIRSGTAAGAQIVAGVLTGAHDSARLHEAGATHVLDSVASLPALLSDKSAPFTEGSHR